MASPRLCCQSDIALHQTTARCRVENAATHPDPLATQPTLMTGAAPSTQEHEVILISDGEEDDAPPAQPLAADAYAGSYSRYPAAPGRTTRAAAALGNGKARYHPDDAELDATAGVKAKRKAALDDDEAAYPPADGALGADVKRRRREDPATGGLPVPSAADYPPDRQYAQLGASTSGALDAYANGAAARAPAAAVYDSGDASRQRREVSAALGAAWA
jgi:hypothetical protein